MINLRPLNQDDLPIIMAWPPYAGDMEQMDYALRQDGWLAQYMDKPATHLFSAESDGELCAFTLLIETAPGEAELRIAIRGDRTGKGLGGEIMRQTLRTGFVAFKFDRIHLIVRKNNIRGIKLYQRLGFTERGELSKMIQGAMVDFYCMDLHKEDLVR
ncbi:spermidine N(1)-acetyltransferase [Geobacter sp. OR-1]|uniref:GNAT family N-acetyltransferase n=1 Tax=Geobacter sp. OR-1 TaxID=1266765 RepID=UPI0005438CA2|nr:GNAT family protein [Geobacter sp. OR-1]GAM08256.1 spermidine N(1)-acetyltransferase [Geobacter sp. OR-1]